MSRQSHRSHDAMDGRAARGLGRAAVADAQAFATVASSASTASARAWSLRASISERRGARGGTFCSCTGSSVRRGGGKEKQ
jgi:hypothetical protein